MTISVVPTANQAPDKAASLRITEIFFSLQGEAREAGWPTVFIRLTGCPLRCTYCDTAYAFHGGKRQPLEAIIKQVQSHSARHICVTGGEPLAQPEVFALMTQFCDLDYQVSLETSGAMDVNPVDARVSRIVDLKTPASGESDKNRYDNLAVLTQHDQIKFVICDRVDFEWACEMVKARKLDQICTVWFSPSAHQLKPQQLADWILEAGVPVRFQLQLHKVVWGDVPGK